MKAAVTRSVRTINRETGLVKREADLVKRETDTVKWIFMYIKHALFTHGVLTHP